MIYIYIYIYVIYIYIYVGYSQDRGVRRPSGVQPICGKNSHDRGSHVEEFWDFPYAGVIWCTPSTSIAFGICSGWPPESPDSSPPLQVQPFRRLPRTTTRPPPSFRPRWIRRSRRPRYVATSHVVPRRAVLRHAMSCILI